jgi:hypothetical protein
MRKYAVGSVGSVKAGAESQVISSPPTAKR